MSSITGNIYEVIGISESFPIQDSVNTDWKHFLVTDQRELTECNPDIESINKLYVKAHITNVRIIETPIKFEQDYTKNQEGYISTGRNLLVEGIICVTIIYTANSEVKSVHSMSYSIPFSDYISLDNAYADVNTAKYTVNVYIEGAFVNLPNERSIYTTVSLYMTAQSDYIVLGNVKVLMDGEDNNGGFDEDGANGILALKNSDTGKIVKGYVSDGKYKIYLDSPGTYSVDLENTSLSTIYDSNNTNIKVNVESVDPTGLTSITVTTADKNNTITETNPIKFNLKAYDTITGNLTGISTTGIDTNLSSAIVKMKNTSNNIEYEVPGVLDEDGTHTTYSFTPNYEGTYDLEVIPYRTLNIEGNDIVQEVDVKSVTPASLTVPTENLTQEITVVPVKVDVTELQGILTISGMNVTDNPSLITSTIIFENSDGIKEAFKLAAADDDVNFAYSGAFFNNGTFKPVKVIDTAESKEYSVSTTSPGVIIENGAETAQSSKAFNLILTEI